MFHILHTDIEPPCSLNNPFCYEPHALTLLAAGILCDYLASQPQWAGEIAEGKMFGVLVCRDADGNLGFLSAYSGQLQGRGDWPWFVPQVFDYLQPDDHFRREEALISQINRQVDELQSSADYQLLSSELQKVKADGAVAVERYREYMRTCKQRRDAQRGSGVGDDRALIAESQYQKAELRRLKRQWQTAVAEAERRLSPLDCQLEAMKAERRHRSDALQQWLFDNFVLLNAKGERRSLTAIFEGTPPSGAGECCAPKLLHYAFGHHLKPLCMGELWQGRSPQMEVRHHGQFYPACRGKCKPILEWMLDLHGESHRQERQLLPTIVYEDDSIVVVSKPSGLLSVPGKQGLPSVESILGQRYGQVFMPHRLDQDTSGLMVVARTLQAYHHLQRQFLQRSVNKDYEALLDGIVEGEGIINLPLRPDLFDRPRQLVDPVHGRPATTAYRVVATDHGRTRVILTPHTGRTHQLRVHCAHTDGLNTPIVGDNLYGRRFSSSSSNETGTTRLCLHAKTLAFQHPDTGMAMTFHDETPF